MVLDRKHRQYILIEFDTFIKFSNWIDVALSQRAESSIQLLVLEQSGHTLLDVFIDLFIGNNAFYQHQCYSNATSM